MTVGDGGAEREEERKEGKKEGKRKRKRKKRKKKKTRKNLPRHRKRLPGVPRAPDYSSRHAPRGA